MAALTSVATASPNMNPSFAQLRRTLHRTPAALLLAVTLAAAPAMAQVAQVPELQLAAQALDRADRADADQYAPDLIASARQLLSQAQAAAAGGRSQRREAPLLAQRATVEADLARVRSEEAAANALLQQRRDEIAELRRKLGMEGAQ